MELSIDRLTKQYQNKIAVDRISLRLNTGIYGLVNEIGTGPIGMDSGARIQVTAAIRAVMVIS